MDALNYSKLTPVLSASQLSACDKATCESEPISSLELMERASRRIYNELLKRLHKHTAVHVVCGFGNNGGDGLCIGRLLISDGFQVRVSICYGDNQPTTENEKNLFFLKNFAPESICVIEYPQELKFTEGELIVDALFGIGLKRKVEGYWLEIIQRINSSGCEAIAIDIPSGMFADYAQNGAGFVQANHTYAVQSPKQSYFLEENHVAFTVVDVGIQAAAQQTSEYYLNPNLPQRKDLLGMLPAKKKFSSKRDFGNLLLIGGNDGMHGAIAMAAKNAIACGAGLTTVMAPTSAKGYLQSIPKAMHLHVAFSSNSVHTFKFDKYTHAIIGPGLANNSETSRFLEDFLKRWDKPLLLDADALNIISANPNLWKWIPQGAVLTPHRREFERLFGRIESEFQIAEIAKSVAIDRGIYLMVKGVYTALYTPDGKVIHNGSGGSWLAQGGSGDSLCGIIGALWARTGDAELASVLGMYLAGLHPSEIQLENI